MSSSPSTTNSAADSVDSVIHTTIMQVALSAALTGAESAQPWLDSPVVKQVFEFMVKEGFSYIDKYIEQAAAFAVMDAQTSIEAKQYQDAVARVKANPNDQAAIADFKSTLARLIHYDGS